MEKFTILSHTADIGIKVKAKTLKKLFENAALGMFSLMVDISKIKPKKSLKIKLKAENTNELFLNWLRELLYQFNTTYILFKKFTIKNLSETKLEAIAYGESVEHKKHFVTTEIKAVTYHEFKIEKKNNFWRARVIFDV